MQKVLIADDQENMRQLVRLTLETGHFEIFEASDGDAALEVARREHPDLIFLDWTMPVMAGVDVCRALQDGPRFGGRLTVIPPAGTQEDDREIAHAMGADDNITKPFS